jgi:adenosylcobyric acid synthase
MNPILLKPLGNYRSSVILDGKFYAEMYAKEYYEEFVLQKGFQIILNALDSLRKENDIVVIEGAGSPAEINISKYDIANMLLADKVCAPVIITADIERGGCFANIVGTMRLLKRSYRKLVIGFLINKFLGEKSLLGAAISYTEKITQKEFFGIIPKIEFNLPNEDSLNDSKHPNYKLDLTKELWDEQIDIIANIVEENINMQKILMKIVR